MGRPSSGLKYALQTETASPGDERDGVAVQNQVQISREADQENEKQRRGTACHMGSTPLFDQFGRANLNSGRRAVPTGATSAALS